ncbi:MAG: peroxidase [Planctomycetes bacterium]|nr:peroxidase [Planctomycetota bacterium]
MHAHSHDLRVEVGDASLADALEAGPWQEAPLSEAELAFCAYAEKLTAMPPTITSDDLDVLRQVGWNDREIHDGCQVIAYFNYINRIADGLGVDPEPDIES